MRGWDILRYWKEAVIVGTPIILCPLPIATGGAREFCCAYVVLIMAIYWMTEVVPLAITAFLPLFLFPLFGVLGAKDVAINYLTDSNFVFVGSMMMALAVEESGLHERIALRILKTMGSNPRWLMLGFQLATAFLSMWMSNTATTAMMVPIALAVIEELARFHEEQRRHKKEKNIKKTNNVYLLAPESIEEMDSQTSENTGTGEFDLEALNKIPKEERKVYKAILLCICYSANIGGTGTLTGTGSNIVLSGQLTKLYPGQNEISFASWMAFAMPSMIILLISSWLWLQLLFIGFRRTPKNKRIERLLKQKYEQLGPMRFQEGITLVLFIVLILLWLTRDPKVFPGWSYFFVDGYVTDGATAMFLGCLLFVLPRHRPQCLGGWRGTSSSKEDTKLLSWPVMQRKFAWSIVILLGGGYAMAAGVKESKLSDWIGYNLAHISVRPIGLLVFIALSIVTFATEVSSNVAAASIFIPIMSTVAVHLETNPLYFILPVTVGCSFAFMLPVATPPNAIVFSSGLIRVIDMALAGFMMNWICIGFTMLNIQTYAFWLFKLGTFPPWASNALTTTGISNITSTLSSIPNLLH